jgi:DNA-directed RNA polymerase subunit RPC12/RpoP
MGRHDDNAEQQHAERQRALVYLPCPACGSAVLLSDEVRVGEDPLTYRCAACGALLELRRAEGR